MFKPADRPGYCELIPPIPEIKSTIFTHSEFKAFHESATKHFTKWSKINTPKLKGFAKDGHPKALIEAISEDLLTKFKSARLLDAYDIYQHLMDYWAETMQDDCYLISAEGWIAAAQPREIIKVKNKDNKLVWPEPHDFTKGNRRFKSDLIPAKLVIDRYFSAERDAIAAIETELATIEQQLDEKREEQSGEEGLLAEVIEGEGDKQKITGKAVKARIKAISDDPDYAEECQALEEYAALLERQIEGRGKLKAAREDLDAKLGGKYPRLREDEIKILVADDKWLTNLGEAAQGELDRVSQTLTGRIRELAERYARPAPQIVKNLAALSSKVEEHLKRMGAVFN